MNEQDKLQSKLFIGAIIIMISLIVNIIYANTQKLDSPIFFKHYYEINTLERSVENIYLHYLTNSNDDREVLYINFPNVDKDIAFSVKQFSDTEYKHYNYKKIALSIEFDDSVYSRMKDKIFLGDALITFNDGATMEVDLGKIILMKYINGSISLDHVMSGSSSGNKSKDIFKLEEPIIINSITTNLLEESKDIINMKIVNDDSTNISLIEDLRSEKPNEPELTLNKMDNVSLIPFEYISLPLQVNSAMSIYTSFDIKEDSKKYNFYRILYLVNFETLSGEKGNEKLLNVRYEPYFTDKDLKNYLKDRGAI